jgi:hypothetical protein
MDWKKPEELKDGVKIPSNWLYIHYYEALTLLFRIENALRVFVYIILKNNFGATWAELSIQSDDANDTTILALSKKRANQDLAFGYLGLKTNSPLMHLTSGELVRLITSDAYWKNFKSYFPAAKETVVLKLLEIGNVRNSLAHFRPIQENDIEVVKQNANQMLSVVENTLSQILNCDQSVPTNTKHDWYTRFSTIGGDYVSLSYNQSNDGNWIQIRCKYTCPVIKSDFSEGNDYCSYSVLTINLNRILHNSQQLREKVLFMDDRKSFYTRRRSHKPDFFKTIRFTFSRQVVETDYEEIKNEFEKLISQIVNESNLIQEDNLASGEIINIANFHGNKHVIGEQTFWDFTSRNFESAHLDNDPVEYWGELYVFGGHVVSSINEYPWMSVAISDFTF